MRMHCRFLFLFFLTVENILNVQGLINAWSNCPTDFRGPLNLVCKFQKDHILNLFWRCINYDNIFSIEDNLNVQGPLNAWSNCPTDFRGP